MKLATAAASRDFLTDILAISNYINYSKRIGDFPVLFLCFGECVFVYLRNFKLRNFQLRLVDLLNSMGYN